MIKNTLLGCLLTLSAGLFTIQAENREQRHQPTKPLHKAVHEDNLIAVCDLIASGADVNERDNNGEIALNYAAAQGNNAMIETLIANGANIDETGHYSQHTPLTTAICTQHPDTALYLLAKGADPKKCACTQAFACNEVTALHYATGMGYTALVERLIELGAATMAQEQYNGDTPLHWASRMGHGEIIKILVMHGADVEMKNFYQCTPRDEFKLFRKEYNDMSNEERYKEFDTIVQEARAKMKN